MKKKGVTVVTLTIVVTVMAILALAALPISLDAKKETQKTRYQAEINQIEILTSNYIRRNSGNDLESYEWDVALAYSEFEEQFEGENIINGKLAVYIVDLNKIDAGEVSIGNLTRGATDRYLYSEKTGHVYYEKGKTIGSTTYYRVPNLEE